MLLELLKMASLNGITKVPLAFCKISSTRFYSKLPVTSNLETVNLSYAYYGSQPASETDEYPPLLVMHGLFGSKRNWHSLCKVFSEKIYPKRRILAVDARNHGDSSHSDEHTYEHLAEDIKSLLKQLNIKKTSLLGHSMGGRTVMYFALKYPELVDKLIVADISPINTSSDLTQTLSLFTAIENIVLPQKIPISSARVICDKQLSTDVPNKSLRSFILTNLVEDSHGGYKWRINIPVLHSHFSKHITRFPDVSGGLTFGGTVLFVSGAESDYILKSEHADISLLFPKAEFQEISGAGHWLHSDKPYEFLNICIEFMNRNGTAS